MKALVYRGVGDVRCESVPDPVLSGPSSAIIRIRSCSICGSDLHPYHADIGVSDFCIGHEAIGEVVELGASVSKFRVGDQVLLPGTLSCGNCAACLIGRVALCETTGRVLTYGMGGPGIGGCQSEGVHVPHADHNLFAIPEDFSDRVALALTDTLSTAWASVRAGGVGPGSTVAVIGLGAVGLQTVMSAFAQGAERVFGIDLVADRLNAALALGAEPVAADEPGHHLLEATAGLGVDVVVDANGSAQTLALALQIVKRGGRIAVSGVPEVMSIPLPVGLAIGKSVSISYVVVSVQAELDALSLAIHEGRLKSRQIEGLFTHQFDLAEGSEAYALFDSRRDGVTKVQLNC